MAVILVSVKRVLYSSMVKQHAHILPICAIGEGELATIEFVTTTGLEQSSVES